MLRLVFFTSITAIVLAEYYKMLEHDPHSPETISTDVDELKHRLKCFVDEGPCNDVALHYKEQLPLWVANTCGRCEPNLKLYIHAAITAAEKYLPEDFEKLKQKFDPSGTVIKRFMKEMEEKSG